MLTSIERFAFIGFRPTGDVAGYTAYTNRKGRVVWFIKSPPKTPFTRLQLRHMRAFEFAARAWSHQTQETRNDWNRAARRAHLYLSGYSLWMHWQLKRDRPAIATIERQSGIQLLG